MQCGKKINQQFLIQLSWTSCKVQRFITCGSLSYEQAANERIQTLMYASATYTMKC